MNVKLDNPILSAKSAQIKSAVLANAATSGSSWIVGNPEVIQISSSF